MGTTADKLNKVLETKQAIKQAIIDKGVEVSDNTKFADYPSKIASIEAGGGDPYYEDLFLVTTANNTNYSYLFYGSNATTIDLSRFNTANVTDMRYMFNLCTNLTSLDVSNFDTSKVTNMQSIFHDCNSLTTLDLSNFDTSNVTNMSYMFYGSGFTTLDLSNFDISNVTTMSNMFNYCRELTLLDVSHFDVSKITASYNFMNAFNNCPALVDFYPPKNINGEMNVSYSKALSHDSLVRIINNLMVKTSTTKLTLGADNLAKLTAEEIAIATNKGWTVS